MQQKSNPPQPAADAAAAERQGLIRHKILVLSGKGGVGKSTVACNLASALAQAGRKVGLLDVDIHGPSIPHMLHLENIPVQMENNLILPIEREGLRILSVGLLLRERDEAVIWRGPMKNNLIRQFLQEVQWGQLDFLVIDSPPGTGDEPLSVCQIANDLSGAIIVTTPQAVATNDARKSINFCRQLQVPILGVVENMSGFVCPQCQTITDIFQSGGGAQMAQEMGVPFLGRIPLDPALGAACDAGMPFVRQHPQSQTAQALQAIIAPLLALDQPEPQTATTENPKEETPMKIAIPLTDGKLCMHFGHCQQFALVEVDQKTKTITSQQVLVPPPHEPGVLPRWLQQQGAQLIIAGGMGTRAQNLFAENGIQVVVGASGEDPAEIARAWLAGTLQSGANVCEH